MRKLNGQVYWRYGLAFFSIALVTGARLLLDWLFPNSSYTTGHRFLSPPFFIAVLLAAWYGGYGPALISVALSASSFAWFWPPPDRMAGKTYEQLERIGVFFLTCLIIALLGATMRAIRRRAERAKEAEQAQREQLHITLKSIGDAVVVTDSQGRVTLLNLVAQTLTGWTQEEAEGRPLDAVFNIVDEQTRHAAENPAVRALRGGTIAGLANQTLLISKDGTQRPVDDSTAPIRDKAGVIKGAILVFRDVSERLRQARELEGRERQFRTLAESIAHLCWMAGPDGSRFWYNRRWYEYTGTTYEQMAGWGWHSVQDPAALPGILERWKECIATGEPFDEVIALRGRDGVFRSFLTRVVPVKDDEGRITRWFGTNTDISEQIQTEEELRDARSRLESTLAAGAVGTWEFDIVRNTIKADPNLARMFGVTPDDAAGGPLEAYMSVIHADDRARVAETIKRTLEAGESYESEYRLSGPDGTVRHLVARGRVERDAAGRAVRLPGVAMDITAQRRAEERERQLLYEAAAANAKFRAFFEQGAIFAGIMDVDGTLLEPNRAAWEGCGYTREEVIGKPFWEGPWWTPSPDLVVQIKAATAQAAAGQAFRAELPYFVADGSQRIADVVILPIKDDAGRVLFLAPTGTDITLRRQMEDSLRRLAADLSEADHRKDEFLATLAHELRNPLAPLRNGLQVMRLAGNNGVAVEQARTMMERQLGQMVRLVDDLLDVSRITRNKLELRKERVDLEAIVRSAIETSRPLIEAAAHELTVTLPPTSICLEADLTRLAQVFSNLLNNAAKYTRPGGHIWLTAERIENEIVIVIKDNGIGIRPDMLPKVFEMFTQADRTLERTQGGLGIGLTLVKRLVEMHRGSVEARSEGLGHGTEFVVRLPILEGRPLRHDPEMPAANAIPAKRRILVVDDNVDSALTLGMMLSMMGNEIHTVYDGLEAVEEAAAFRPDMILLDIGLPKLNGYEACRRIREQPWGNDMVIIACTGWGQEEDIRRGKEAGFDRHMVKPVDPAALHAILVEYRPAGTAVGAR